MSRTMVILSVLTAIVATLGPAAAIPATGVEATARSGLEQVHALAVDAAGRSLWLGAHTGLFHSEDSGATWTKLALPGQLPALDVMAVTPDPRDAAVLYIATREAGVLKTTDSGERWRTVNGGLGGRDVQGLAIDRNAPMKLYALVRDSGAGVYRTTNGGEKWVRVDGGPGGDTKGLASVALPAGMTFVYAGTAAGLQRSPDCF
jgi:photosystem II stability/assembly factor-like uncharacterized protein